MSGVKQLFTGILLSLYGIKIQTDSSSKRLGVILGVWHSVNISGILSWHTAVKQFESPEDVLEPAVKL